MDTPILHYDDEDDKAVEAYTRDFGVFTYPRDSSPYADCLLATTAFCSPYGMASRTCTTMPALRSPILTLTVYVSNFLDSHLAWHMCHET